MKQILISLLITSLIAGCKNQKKESEEMVKEQSLEIQKKLPRTKKSAQTSVVIHPVSHATAVLEWQNLTIYIDPVGGGSIFEGYAPPDLILITDIHGDHLSISTLEELDTGKAKIMAPQAVADQIPNEFTPQIDVLHNGDAKERYGILVEAVPMYNLREEALKFHVKGRGNGYILNIGGERIYFSGDTEDIPEMRALQNIDRAFVCMNLPYTMNVESAADAVLEFKPRQVYPYHYRGRPDISDVEYFRELIDKGNTDIEVVQLDWYPGEDY